MVSLPAGAPEASADGVGAAASDGGATEEKKVEKKEESEEESEDENHTCLFSLFT